MTGMGIIEGDQSCMSSVNGKDADRGWFNGQSLKKVQWKPEVVCEGKLDGALEIGQPELARLVAITVELLVQGFEHDGEHPKSATGGLICVPLDVGHIKVTEMETPR